MACACSAQGQSDSFALTGSMIAARYQFTMTLLPNGTVLVAGGCSAGGGDCLSSAEIYNPVTATFATTGSMSAKRWGHTATLLQSGLVLITGGCTGGGSCLSSAELYNPATGSFTLTTGPMNEARYDHTATLLPDGKVLITGGCQASSSCFSNAEVYNPVAGTFTLTSNSMAAKRWGQTATLLNNGEVLVAGGCTGNGSCNSSADLYNPATGTFSSAGNMTTPRYDHTATILSSGKVLLAGGCTGGGECLSSAEVYSPTAGTFTATGNMSDERYAYQSAFLEDGTVLVAGGCGGPCEATADIYNPSSGTFTATGSMSTKRYNFASARLQNGTVLVSGGCTGGGDCPKSAEIYTPEAAESGYVNPKFIVVGVTYAPPGPSSYTQYTTTSSVGTTTTLTNSFESQVMQSIAITQSGLFGFAGGKVTDTSATTASQTSSTTQTVTVTAQSSTSDKTPGTANPYSPVDHEYDIIWVWLNPVALFTVYPSLPSSLTWTGYGYDTNDQPALDIYPLYVGNLECELNSNSPTCATSGPFNQSTLNVLARSWAQSTESFPSGQSAALTTTDYQTILDADPWGANPSYVVDASGSPATTPDGRFTISGGVTGAPIDFPYVQALPGDPPITEIYSNGYTETNSLGQSATYSYQVMFGTDLSFSGSGWLTGLSVEIKNSNTLTWTSVYDSTITDTNTQLDALQITGPPCVGSPCNPSYSGPGEFDVYQDNIYGTFMFWAVN